MNMIKFEGLENSIIPTIASAVSQKTREFQKFSDGLGGKNAAIIHLRTLYDVTDCLCGGLCHFHRLKLNDKHPLNNNEEYRILVERHTTEFMEIWENIERTIIDEARHGITPGLRGFFEVPRPQALLGINVMLDAQFHISADPSIFLVRHLMTRIMFAAYVANIPASVRSGSIELVRNLPLENEWKDSQDLCCAAILHSDGRFAPEHFAFRTTLCRELILMENLFELALRQLSEMIV